MSMNKYGGVNDMPSGWTRESYLNKKIYQLWYDIHRRCYDSEQQARAKGRAYADCVVCERWHYLKNFAEDIAMLNGFKEWSENGGMSIDKDIKANDSQKIYSQETCMFVTNAENTAEMNSRHPDITKNAQEANKTTYVLIKGDDCRIFQSEKEACAFLGVKQCSVAGAWRDRGTCKGYKVYRTEMGGESDG